MTFEETIIEVNEMGWLLHSLSQYYDRGKLVWSTTLRQIGDGRRPISRGQGISAESALWFAMANLDKAEPEPETTVRSAPAEPSVSLASLLPRPAFNMAIRRR
jgi:hypothetical protein